MIKFKAAVAVAVSVFLALTGTQASHALWSTQATTAVSVTSGNVGVTSSGFDALGFTYQSGALTKTVSVTITNAGTVASTYTARLSAPASTFASAVSVQTWLMAGNCSTTSGAVTSSSWTSGTTLTGTLAPNAAAVHCVRTTLTSAQLTANDGSLLTAQMTTSTTVGSSAWTATAATLTAAQSVLDTLAPTAPGRPALTAPATTDSDTSFTWAASTDNNGITGYDVYRGATLIAAGITATAYTDTGLNVGTAYTYTVRARDARNVSAASPGYTVTTLTQPNPGKWYRVSNPSSGLCVGAPVIVLTGVTCASAPLWKFSLNGGYIKVLDSDSALVWDNSKKNGSGGVPQLGVDTKTTTDTSEQWLVQGLAPAGSGKYTLSTVGRGECLTVPSATAGVNLTFAVCSGSLTQAFTLTAVTP